MAVTITSNRKNTSAVIHVSSANASIVVSGNSSVSNVAMQDEVLTGGYITQIAWGCDGNGHIQFLRNGAVVSVYDSTGYIDYSGCGISLTMNQAANLNINFVGSSNAYCIFEIQKVGNFKADY